MISRQVVIGNPDGGNTIIGTELVAKSALDDYTLLLAGSAGIVRNEFVLVVHPAPPVTIMQELIALAKKKPSELNYATSSTGGATTWGRCNSNC